MENILTIAALVSLLVQALRKAPATASIWKRVPDGWRWAVPLALAFAGTVADAAIAGAPLWPESIHAGVAAGLATWLASMGLAAAGKEIRNGR
jgi:hypothetical protein